MKGPPDVGIAVDLQGGLGNQLFQYAAGRALAEARGVPLALTQRLFARDRKRRYALDPYPIAATVLDADRFPEPGPLRRLAASIGLRAPSAHRNLRSLEWAPRFDEDDTAGCWDSRIASVRPPAVLRGYFQSPRYFAPIAETLRRELVPTHQASDAFQRLQQEIREAGQTSASLHIRRGDYQSDPETRAKHGMLEATYYRPAWRALDAQVPGAALFVFSDDPGAAHGILPTDARITMVSGQGLSDVEELELMRRCRHHVIANSSFSWWGAWLGEPTGLTLAPRRWFAQGSASAIRDRFPEHWQLVDEDER